ncbi:MAG: hypothetical protein FGM33_02790 [Candidatus Kapabacteria bacterium]|nr:hypothetical protein [Candidatus Kapabacteria bacterium]
MRLVQALFALVFFIATAQAGLLPGRDAYLIRQEAQTLPNGTFRQGRNMIMERPAAGTYVPGVILVKTKQPRGIFRDRSAIEASPLNADLVALQVADVSSAYMNLQDGRVAQAVGLDRIYRIRYSEPLDPFDACAKLMDNPDVEYAVPERIHKPFLVPNDARYSSQPWMQQMKLPAAWDISKGASTVIIAIIDSGTDWSHEDLSGNIWTNTKETPNNGRDDDNNGYIDDVRGWDFVGNITTTDANAGRLKPDNDPKVSGSINDQNGHGTVVAGCAGATTNNTLGVASTGFSCRIIPIKVGSDNPSVRGLLRGYDAIAYAADLGAHIINCSWGGAGIDPGAQSVIDYALSKGSLVIAASGNDGQNNDSYLQSPASLDGVLSVGSCNGSDRVSGFSNYGMNVDIYAPGENILSTYAPNTYRGLSGTSFSSPLVSGIAGLIKAARPTWTPEMIAAQLRGTVDQLQGVTADNRRLYWGRVNAERALTTNASFTSGNRAPGLMLSDLTINGSQDGKITGFDKTSVKFTLKNVLADASDVRVTLTVLDGFVKLHTGTTLALGNITRNSQASGTIDLELEDNFPWYNSNVRISLTIASGTYVNHEVLFVPVELSTQNSFSMVYQSGSANWDRVDMTDDGTIYSTGTIFGQRAMLRASGGSGGFLSTPFAATVLRGISSTNVMIGGLNSGKATVARSFNGGQSWSNVDVSTLLSSVAGINLFDAQTAVAVGNPVGGKLGLARSTNGGTAWAAIAGTPVALAGESVTPGCVASHGDAMWFGTSSGRVFYSLNKGVSWSQASTGLGNVTIVSLAFRDSSNGIILYRPTANGVFRLASTSNGGLNWKAGTADINTTMKVTPVSVLANAGHHVMVCSNGEVYASDNNGVNWQTVLSRPVAGPVAASANVVGRPTIVMSGEEIGVLQYRYAGPNGSKLPSFSANEINFGAMESGQTRNRTATLRNNGTSDMNVSKYEIVPQGSTPTSAFSIPTPPRTTVSAAGSITIPVRCTGADTGTYRAVLRVTSDGTPSSIDLPLVATVQLATSVSEDLAAMGTVNVWPNPTSTSFSLQTLAPCKATLVNSVGAMISSWAVEPGTSNVDVAGLPKGAYRLVLTHGLGVRTLSVIVE